MAVIQVEVRQRIRHDAPIGVKTLTSIPTGKFLARRGLRKFFPEVLEYFSDRTTRILGAIWQKEKKKLHVLIYSQFFDEITMYTFELE